MFFCVSVTRAPIGRVRCTRSSSLIFGCTTSYVPFPLWKTRSPSCTSSATRTSRPTSARRCVRSSVERLDRNSFESLGHQPSVGTCVGELVVDPRAPHGKNILFSGRATSSPAAFCGEPTRHEKELHAPAILSAHPIERVGKLPQCADLGCIHETLEGVALLERHLLKIQESLWGTCGIALLELRQ